MDNYEIADQLSLISKLMDIHGENAFKSKSFASAAFTIEKYPTQLTTLPKEKMERIKGIGESVSSKIDELITTGEIAILKDLIAKTPEGVLEMMNIKGLGPKKINTIWQEMQIDTIEDLEEACTENRLAEKKGFGEKTQQKILEAILFKQQNSGSYLYAQVEAYAEAMTSKLKKKFSTETIEITGAIDRQLEIIEKLEWVTTVSKKDLEEFFNEGVYSLLEKEAEAISFITSDRLTHKFYCTDSENFYITKLQKSSSTEFFEALKNLEHWNESKKFNSEKEVFENVSLPYIPPYLRENTKIINTAKKEKLPEVLQTGDIKGLIHAHSNWSDGGNTIDEMVVALIRLGFEYLVLSDHSKAAFYAGGLSEQKIIEQHQYIDTLNKKYAPFKIYKSIECDILSDGSLDYSNGVLASFDLVIASIHSNLQMTEEKAMQRLLGAIKNPYTTILGHMTGRRLLKRASYPVNHQNIIDACAEHEVVIEINANPERLDMEWQWVDAALERNILLSINPDAHTIDEFSNIKYGVLVAQKGGLTKKNNLSSFSRDEFDLFLKERKASKGI